MDTISIKEYARLKGITVQAVYKKLKTPLYKPYIIKENGGQTKLIKAILDDPQINDNSTKHSTRFSTVEREFSTIDSTVERGRKAPVSGTYCETEDSTVERNHSTVDSTVEQPFKTAEKAPGDDLTALLQKQLEIKDEQIKALTERLQAEQDRNAETLKSLQFEQGRNRELEQQLKLLQAPAEDQPQEQPDQPQKGFRAWWNNFWNISTPQH